MKILCKTQTVLLKYVSDCQCVYFFASRESSQYHYKPFFLGINRLSIGQMSEWAQLTHKVLQSEHLTSLAFTDCMITNLLVITSVH